MPSARRTVSARNQVLLNRDLGYGQPVLYRRTPGPVMVDGKLTKRAFYDPRRPENQPVSEDYYLRVYKPRLSELERTVVNKAVIRNVRQQRQLKYSLAQTWMAKQQALGFPVTKRNVALKDAEFVRLYAQFRQVSYEARHQGGLENTNRDAYFAVGSEYANLLTALGRRTGEETFPVGESPKHAGVTGSYINDVVLPQLQYQKDALRLSQLASSRAKAAEIRGRLNK